MKRTTLERGLALLGLALAVRRRRRNVIRGLRVLRRALLVLGVAAPFVIAIVWSRRKRARVDEVPSGSRPVLEVGTETPKST